MEKRSYYMRQVLIIIIAIFLSISAYAGTFDGSAYEVSDGETSSATKQNNMITALENSINNIVTGQITDLTIQNADIANGTIDLTAKVTGVLPAANAASSIGTVATSGIWTTDSNGDSSGARNVTITGSYIIGSASMNEADLEQLDDLTAGTITASKAVVVDSNKDVGDFRNITFTGALNTDVSATELSYVDGVTSAIQTQLDGKMLLAYPYDSGWFTANTATTYTKAHSLSVTNPADSLDIIILWRASSGGSYVVPIDYGADTTSGDGSGCSYDGTNIYVKAASRWGRYVDSAGSFQNAGNGELRILAQEVN